MSWRYTRALVIVLCCAVLLVCASGCGRNQDRRLQAVTRLLDEGKVDDALAGARTLVEQDVVAASEAAAALVKWASEPRNPDTAIATYFAALELAPDAAGAYIGLGRLLQPAPIKFSPTVCTRITGYWRTGSALNADLAKDDKACGAVSAIAEAGGDYQLAADLAPENGELQLDAAIALCQQGPTSRATPYAEKATRLLGKRADTLMVQATLGTLKPEEVATVCDVPTTVQAGAVIGVDATHAYMMVPPMGSPRRLVSVALANGNIETLVQAWDVEAALTGDGMWLAYATFTEWEQPCEIRVLNLSTREDTLLTTTKSAIESMSWSSDGSRLAVTSHEGLVTVNRDGSDRRLLVATIGDQEHIEMPCDPGWSPDGRRIAYRLGKWEQYGPAFVMTSTGGEPAIAADGEVLRVNWLDDNRIAYWKYSFGDPASLGAIEIKEASAAAPSAKRLTDGHVSPSLLAISPDGSKIMIGLSLCQNRMDLPEVRVWVSDASGDALQLLPMPYVLPDSAFWIPDGTIYYCTDNRLVGFRLKN